MANNIFENAQFGDKFRTRDGRMAIFHNRKLTRILGKGLCECYHLTCDKLNREIECYCDGRESLYHDDVLDIVGKWQETPLEVESSKVAGKLLMLDKAKTWLMRKYPKIFDERTILDFENDMIK